MKPIGREVIDGLREAVSHAKGERTETRITTIKVPNDIDVRAIRNRLGLSQEAFAMRFAFSLGTVRHWEQGRRYPEGPARVLLKVIDHNPEAVQKALAAS